MKPNVKRGGGIREGGWDVSIAKGLGPALFGGTFQAAFAVEPLEPALVPDYERLKDACGMTARGAICKVSGPARLMGGTKAGKVSADALPGDNADVEMWGTRISCHDG